MPQYGYPKLKIMLDTTDGGALVDISSYVTSIGGYSLERLLEESMGRNRIPEEGSDRAERPLR